MIFNENLKNKKIKNIKHIKNKEKYMIGNDWDSVLKKEFESDYYKKIEEFIKAEYATKTV